MTAAENALSVSQAPSTVFREWQTAWVSEAVARMNRVFAAESEISKGIAQLVDASLEAAVSSQKDMSRLAGEVMANPDPIALVTLPQRFLEAAIRDGLANSVRNLQTAQTLLSQIYAATSNSGDGECHKP